VEPHPQPLSILLEPQDSCDGEGSTSFELRQSDPETHHNTIPSPCRERVRVRAGAGPSSEIRSVSSPLRLRRS
jgi:hypothetical protein